MLEKSRVTALAGDQRLNAQSLTQPPGLAVTADVQGVDRRPRTARQLNEILRPEARQLQRRDLRRAPQGLHHRKRPGPFIALRTVALEMQRHGDLPGHAQTLSRQGDNRRVQAARHLDETPPEGGERAGHRGLQRGPELILQSVGRWRRPPRPGRRTPERLGVFGRTAQGVQVARRHRLQAPKAATRRDRGRTAQKVGDRVPIQSQVARTQARGQARKVGSREGQAAAPPSQDIQRAGRIAQDPVAGSVGIAQHRDIAPPAPGQQLPRASRGIWR